MRPRRLTVEVIRDLDSPLLAVRIMPVENPLLVIGLAVFEMRDF